MISYYLAVRFQCFSKPCTIVAELMKEWKRWWCFKMSSNLFRWIVIYLRISVTSLQPFIRGVSPGVKICISTSNCAVVLLWRTLDVSGWRLVFIFSSSCALLLDALVLVNYLIQSGGFHLSFILLGIFFRGIWSRFCPWLQFSGCKYSIERHSSKVDHCSQNKDLLPLTDFL